MSPHRLPGRYLHSAKFVPVLKYGCSPLEIPYAKAVGTQVQFLADLTHLVVRTQDKALACDGIKRVPT